MNVETGRRIPSKENLCGCGKKSTQLGSFGGDDDSIAVVTKFSSSSTQLDFANIETIKQNIISYKFTSFALSPFVTYNRNKEVGPDAFNLLYKIRSTVLVRNLYY